MSGSVTGAGPIRALFVLAIVLFAAWLTSIAAMAAEQPEPVHFKPGTTSTIVRGTLKGWDMKEYALRANKGQTARLEVRSKRINWLIVRFYPADKPDGDNDVFNSDNSNAFTWQGPLPENGEYVIRFFIRRAEARRGGSVNYSARLEISPAGHPAQSPQSR